MTLFKVNSPVLTEYGDSDNKVRLDINTIYDSINFSPGFYEDLIIMGLAYPYIENGEIPQPNFIDQLAAKVSKGYNHNLNISDQDPYLEIASGGGSASLHLTNEPGFTGPYIFGLGKDFDGTGMMLPNKANGRMISGDQRAEVTDPASHWMRVTQQSTAAPLIRLEQNVNDAAAVLQLQQFGTSTATQHLLYVGNQAGEIGKIYSNDGSLTWLKDIVVHDNNSSGGKLRIKQGTAVSSQSHVIGDSKGFEWYNYTGSANLWYPFGIKANSNTLEISGGANSGTVGGATLTPVIKIQNNKIGFFNTAPIAKPTITGSRGGNVALASLLTTLSSFGLIVDSTTA